MTGPERALATLALVAAVLILCAALLALMGFRHHYPKPSPSFTDVQLVTQ